MHETNLDSCLMRKIFTLNVHIPFGVTSCDVVVRVVVVVVQVVNDFNCATATTGCAAVFEAEANVVNGADGKACATTSGVELSLSLRHSVVVCDCRFRR